MQKMCKDAESARDIYGGVGGRNCKLTVQDKNVVLRGLTRRVLEQRRNDVGSEIVDLKSFRKSVGEPPTATPKIENELTVLNADIG